jgi:hypothetical protein
MDSKMCDNFVKDFAKKVVKYNCCQYCVKRFEVCKNLDHFYNHINPNTVGILLRNYMADEDDIDALLTALHINLHPFKGRDLVKFLYDMQDEEYVLNAIRQHLNCINNDNMPYIKLLENEYYEVWHIKKPDNMVFTDWLKKCILKE